ncbi:hypothetical protein BASA50_009344 [Batrachochytrium salamandrivorans]|uniref:Uncharacterized protein n=1 Tax=Batrachochytrium salamandrivorans TaxID=1357716 RepID=A0ABQ8F1G6_9FUNG|nr:hypothetical protein BASA50_009344 [Batrachochytrium salamandrivorans]KAH9255010.1 hypothetical protein BASA81_006955 [Batrachochytrium salamandrivorans]
MSYTIACANSIFEIFENPALEEDDDFPSAISFDIALFEIFETPALEEDEDINIFAPAISKDIALGKSSSSSRAGFSKISKIELAQAIV